MNLDPRTRPYEPRGAALQLFYCKDDEVLLDGPAGTGKTRAVLEKIHLCLLKYAGARALIVRKTRRSMTNSVLVTFEEKVLPEGSPLKDGPTRAMREIYRYSNGSELVVGGMDNADKVMSTEYDLIGVFEATELTEDDWEKLTSRLRNGILPFQQLLADCNPAGPMHWLNQRCNGKQTTRLLSRHEDNPTVTEAYLQKLRALTGARRLRLYKGVWAAQEGMVYDEWDAAIHVIDPFAIPPEWPRFRAIDFGYTNPFVCQWWALDGDGRMYLYREWYMSGRIVDEHAAIITELSGDERIIANVADPEDADGRATLARHGIATAPAKKAVLLGIETVKKRLKVQADGRPRLFLFRDCVVEQDDAMAQKKRPWATDQEIEGYVWHRDKTGIKNEREEPIKADDHGVDALRYAVMFAESGGLSGGMFR